MLYVIIFLRENTIAVWLPVQSRNPAGDQSFSKFPVDKFQQEVSTLRAQKKHDCKPQRRWSPEATYNIESNIILQSSEVEVQCHGVETARVLFARATNTLGVRDQEERVIWDICVRE